MHPLGRSDKRALKLPLLSFNGVIDPDSGMYVARSLRDPPRMSLLSTDIDRSARRKNISDVSCALLPLHTRTRKCPLVPARIVRFYIRATRASARDRVRRHIKRSRGRNTSREGDLLSRSLSNGSPTQRKGVDR